MPIRNRSAARVAMVTGAATQYADFLGLTGDQVTGLCDGLQSADRLVAWLQSQKLVS